MPLAPRSRQIPVADTAPARMRTRSPISAKSIVTLAEISQSRPMRAFRSRSAPMLVHEPICAPAPITTFRSQASRSSSCARSRSPPRRHDRGHF